jgi:hypothetical protein
MDDDVSLTDTATAVSNVLDDNRTVKDTCRLEKLLVVVVDVDDDVSQTLL